MHAGDGPEAHPGHRQPDANPADDPQAPIPATNGATAAQDGAGADGPVPLRDGATAPDGLDAGGSRATPAPDGAVNGAGRRERGEGRDARRARIRGRVLRAAGWSMVAAGVAAPIVRKRVKVAPAVMQAVAFGAPLGLAVAMRRSRGRDVAICCLQMWAYLAAYKAPHDDPEALLRRVHIDYPMVLDRLIGGGQLPSVRLQRRLARRNRWSVLDRTLVWAHWLWFAVPHASLGYVLWRRRERFPRAAVMTYAVFDLGAIVYWTLPTAPPWYAAEVGGGRRSAPVIRRMMAEYGQVFWRERWGPLYKVFGGNPFAAMPSLHFATSLMAASVLTDSSPVAGAVGWTYTGTLGFALVYLGEHYVVDLIAGAALTAAVHKAEPAVRPLLARVGREVARIEEMAHPG